MQKPELYINPLKYKNELELLEYIIRIYSVVMLDDDLENHEEKVLMFYFKYGYSPDTKEKIKNALNISSHYLNTINYHLDKKGYLKKDERNKQKKHLSDGLRKLKEAFVDKGVRTYVIHAKKDDRK